MGGDRLLKDDDMNQSLVAQILMQKWDPLGLKDVIPADEYSHYAGMICNMIEKGKSAEDLQAYLRLSRLTDMREKANDEVDRDVIKEIIKLK